MKANTNRTMYLMVTEVAIQIKLENISTAEDQSDILTHLNIVDSKNALSFKEENIQQNVSMPFQYTEANQIKLETISTAEDQSDLLTPLDIVDSNISLDFKEENIEQNYQNVSMPYQYTIKESELIIESKPIYENSITSSVVDVSTNTEPCDYNFSQDTNETAEEFATVDEPLLSWYNNVPHEYANDEVANVINNPLSYSVRITNVASWAKQDNLLYPISQPPQTPLRRKVGRPKRTATAKKISYSGSAKRTRRKRTYKKRKIAMEMSPLCSSSHSNKTNNNRKYPRTNESSTKATDFPRPLKLEIPTKRTTDNDIATELPRPMVLKCESQSSTNLSRSYLSWKLQPKVCLKRLSHHDIEATHKPKQKSARSAQSSLSYSRAHILEVPKQLHVSDSSILEPSPYMSITQSNDIPHYLAPRDQTSTPGTESSASNSHFDSGVSNSSLSHAENDNILLEIAAERAFINHHLTNFGFSPVQFELYNDLKELCIFLKYLCGKLNKLN